MKTAGPRPPGAAGAADAPGTVGNGWGGEVQPRRRSTDWPREEAADGFEPGAWRGPSAAAHADHLPGAGDFGGRRYAGDAAPRRVAPKGYVRSDARIREDVCDRLYASGLDVADVDVEVRGGVVSLDGSVAERRIRNRIEAIAGECLGVKAVDNRVRVIAPAG